jgi:hypothetical protein
MRVAAAARRFGLGLALTACQPLAARPAPPVAATVPTVADDCVPLAGAGDLHLTYVEEDSLRTS